MSIYNIFSHKILSNLHTNKSQFQVFIMSTNLNVLLFNMIVYAQNISPIIIRKLIHINTAIEQN